MQSYSKYILRAECATIIFIISFWRVTVPLQHLPRWIQFAMFILACNAGMVNVLGMLMVLHQSISHMTGNVSLLAIHLWQHDFSQVFFLVSVLISFVLGAFYSGYILGNAQFSLSQRYGIPLVCVAIFIVLCWLFTPYFPRYALLWATVAMGMQNAMVSHYQGAIIRTTHLSGVLTDLGLALGYFLRGLQVEKRRVILHLAILLGFLFGGLIATISFHYFNYHAFLIPALCSAVLSLIYWLHYWKQNSA